MAARIGMAMPLADQPRTDPRVLAPGRAWLEPGQLACSGCGRAVPAGADGAMGADEVVLEGTHPQARPVAIPLGKCSGCAALDVAARAMGAEDRSVARLLVPFRLLGKPLPDPARVSVAELRRWFGRFAGLDWASRLWRTEEYPQSCTVEPWAHVSPEIRATLVAQFARWMRSRAMPGAPLRIPAPRMADGTPGGCLMCGLAAVEIPAEQSHSIPPEALWRPVTADPGALGGKGGQRIAGALCKACDDAATDAEGRRVIGPTAMEVALARWWEGHGEPDAARWLRHGEFGGVTAWAITGRAPNRVPWGHMAVPELAED